MMVEVAKHRSVDSVEALPMRLRFSLRLVLVIITLSALALYWFLVRPTENAYRFVAAVEAHDYETARRLLQSDFWAFLPQPKDRTTTIDLVYAEVLPREWSDIWRCRRRLILRVNCHDDTYGRHVEWTNDNDVVSRSRGVEFEKQGMVWDGTLTL